MALTETEAKHPGELWPSHEQVDLLHAALFSSEKAVRAARRWLNAVDINELDEFSYCLAPMLHHNLRALGIDDPVLPKLKGIRRRNWCANQLLMGRIQKLVRRLDEAGIQSLMLSDLGLLWSQYPDTGLLQLRRLDVLTRRHATERVVRIVQELDWTLDWSRPEHDPAEPRFIFRGADGTTLALHCTALAQGRAASSEPEIWNGAATLAFEDVETLTLNATDHLMWTCAHGLQHTIRPDPRWIVHAVILLTHPENDIVLARLERAAERYELTLVLRTALRFLHAAFDLPIAADVLERLELRRVSALERLELRYRLRPLGPTLRERIVRSLLNYRRLSAGQGMAPRAVGLPAFLRLRWQRNRSPRRH